MAATRTTISRIGDFSKITDVLVPFLVSRQLICGAGKVLHTGQAEYSVSQRAEHIWESVSSATTRGGRSLTPATSRTRIGALPTPARHRRGLEHERDDHAVEGGERRAGAAAH